MLSFEEPELEFAEPLPSQCPPSDAADCEWSSIYRLIETEAPSPEAFMSHAALGKTPPPKMDPCRWASCSLVFDARKQKKLPVFKNHHWAAHVKIPIGSGFSKKTSGNHVDFWCGQHFNIVAAVLEVIAV